MRKDIVSKGEKGGVRTRHLQVCSGDAGLAWTKPMHATSARDLWMGSRGNTELQHLLENEGFEEDGGRLHV